MNKIAKHLLIVVVMIGFIGGVQAGELFRNLETGESQSIFDHQEDGKWLIVMLWASDCIACNKEAHQYVDFHQRHKDDDAVVLGISLDGERKSAEAEAFVKRHEVNFTNLLAEDIELMNYYQDLTNTAWVGTPTFLIYGPDGALEAKQVGAVPADIIEMFLQQYGNG